LGFGVVLLGICTTDAWASLCDSAARQAAEDTGVPLDVMQTITRLETGRGKAADPWPWTVNHAGNGSWFKTEDDARSYVFSQLKRGETNLDIGCFQINYRWHADGFRSLDDMFNPSLNALYAAQFLTDLYREFGSWTQAAGAYHSRTPKYAERYKAKFRTLRTKVAQTDLTTPSDEVRQATAPWGHSGQARPGSLFLSDASDAPPFIALHRSN
jgi:hypothetical protein